MVVRVRRVIVRDDLCGRSDPRSGCCQLVDLLDPLPRLPDCRLCVAAAALRARSSHRTKGDNVRRTRRYLGRSRCRVASVYICVSSKCTLARRQPGATRRSHQTNFGMPRATWHRPLARVRTGTRSEPHPQRVAEVLLQGRFAAPQCRRPPVARLAQSDAIAVTGALRYSTDYAYEL